MKGPWILQSQSDIAEDYGEDGLCTYEVYFQIVTNKAGYRFVGHNLGDSRSTSREQRIAWSNINTPMPDDFDPETHPDWQPTFPVYGSDAYCQSGQADADRESERRGEPYHPA